MSNRRSASRGSFNGKKYVLDDDSRLTGGTPTRIPTATTFTVPTDRQVLAFARIEVAGTLVIDGTLVMF